MGLLIITSSCIPIYLGGISHHVLSLIILFQNLIMMFLTKNQVVRYSVLRTYIHI